MSGVFVNTEVLRSKSRTAENLAFEIGKGAVTVRQATNNLEYQVRSRNGIDTSLQSIRYKITAIQTRMKNIGNYLSDTATIYEELEADISRQIYAFLGLPEHPSVSPPEDVPKKRWWQTNTFKFIAGAVVVGAAVTAVIITGGAVLAVGAAVGALSGAAVGGVAGGIISVASGGNFVDGAADGVFFGSITGAISGMIGAACGVAVGAGKISVGASKWITRGSSGLLSAGEYLGQSLMNNETPTLAGTVGSVVLDSGISVITSSFSKRISKKVSGWLGFRQLEYAIPNKQAGTRREDIVRKQLKRMYPAKKGFVINEEVYLRNSAGKIVKDIDTSSSRRVDFIVSKNRIAVDVIEVTSLTANKSGQLAKESRIRALGGNFYKVPDGSIIEIPQNVRNRLVRLK